MRSATGSGGSDGSDPAALSATRENVQWMVAIGVALGLPLSLGAGKLMQSQLYKLTWHDPQAMLCALLTVLIIAALASPECTRCRHSDKSSERAQTDFKLDTEMTIR